MAAVTFGVFVNLPTGLLCYIGYLNLVKYRMNYLLLQTQVLLSTIKLYSHVLLNVFASYVWNIVKRHGIIDKIYLKSKKHNLRSY